jgi:hypothetical protein
MAIHTTELKSSWLASASYDDETSVMTVTTKKGDTFTHEVPKSAYVDLAQAESPGRHYTTTLGQAK